MKFSKEQVFAACGEIAPRYNLEITLIQALCLQEGGRNKDGTFAPDRARLENGFYSKYIEGEDMATSSEILLSASYGVLQLMGESLKELGFFQQYFSYGNQWLGQPFSQLAIPSALDWFCENLDAQIDYGCRWFKVKLLKAGGSVPKALGYWNGDVTGRYAGEVLLKQKALNVKH